MHLIAAELLATCLLHVDGRAAARTANYRESRYSTTSQTAPQPSVV